MKLFLSTIAITFMLCSFSFEDETKSELVLDVLNIPSIEGKLSVLVFNSEDGFPEKKEKAIIKTTVDVTSKSMKVNLGVVPHGNYAIAIIHDKNSNKEFDKNLIGLPKEAFGFSNTYRLTFGPPSFSEATIPFNGKNNPTIKLMEI